MARPSDGASSPAPTDPAPEPAPLPADGAGPVGGVVRIRRVTIGEPGEGGGEPPPSQGTVPTGPSGTPIVTVGGGIQGAPAPPTPAPVSPVVPIPPAPAPQPVIGPPAPPTQGPPTPTDWWEAMPVGDRADLVRQIESLQANTGRLETSLAQAANVIGVLQAELDAVKGLAGPPGPPGLPGPPGETGPEGPAGPPGRDGRDGRDGAEFARTPEYANIVSRLNITAGRDTDQDRAIQASAVRLDSIQASVRSVQTALASVAGTVGGVMTIPGPPGPVGPSGPRGDTGPMGPAGPMGPMGPAGPAIASDALLPTVQEALRGITIPTGPPGPAGASGASGPPGPPGPPPTPEQIRPVVEQVLSGLSDLVRDPAEYIWDVIIKGIGTRLGRLFDAIVEAL